jgi:hypothetical protein
MTYQQFSSSQYSQAMFGSMSSSLELIKRRTVVKTSLYVIHSSLSVTDTFLIAHGLVSS